MTRKAILGPSSENALSIYPYVSVLFSSSQGDSAGTESSPAQPRTSIQRTTYSNPPVLITAVILTARLVTKITSAEYDPTAVDMVWERILMEVIPNDVDRAFFQRWAGYCLTGRTQEKIILALHGPAGSGKSTVSEPFSRAMGQYSALWQPDVIVDRSGVNTDEATFRIAVCCGASMLMSS